MPAPAAIVYETTVVAASAAHVWQALVDGEERSRWWGNLDLEPTTGGCITERWTDDDGTPQLTQGEVVSLDEGRLLQLRWADESWSATTDIEVRLEDAEGGTRVTVRESGWERLPDGEALAEEHSTGWRMHLTHLRGHVETSRAIVKTCG